LKPGCNFEIRVDASGRYDLRGARGHLSFRANRGPRRGSAALGSISCRKAASSWSWACWAAARHGRFRW